MVSSRSRSKVAPLVGVIWWILIRTLPAVSSFPQSFSHRPPVVGRARRDSVLSIMMLVPSTTTTTTQRWMISTGFSFDDGEQILVSVKKPLGIVLEQQYSTGNNDYGGDGASKVYVANVDPTASAGRAGILQGDVLLAVQNTSIESWDLDNVLQLIRQSPAVVNLRFKRDSPRLE